jgi:hypothetical protein
MIPTSVLQDAIRFLEKVYTGQSDTDRLVHVVGVLRKEVETRKKKK